MNQHHITKDYELRSSQWKQEILKASRNNNKALVRKRQYKYIESTKIQWRARMHLLERRVNWKISILDSEREWYDVMHRTQCPGKVKVFIEELSIQLKHMSTNISWKSFYTYVTMTHLGSGRTIGLNLPDIYTQIKRERYYQVADPRVQEQIHPYVFGRTGRPIRYASHRVIEWFTNPTTERNDQAILLTASCTESTRLLKYRRNHLPNVEYIPFVTEWIEKDDIVREGKFFTVPHEYHYERPYPMNVYNRLCDLSRKGRNETIESSGRKIVRVRGEGRIPSGSTEVRVEGLFTKVYRVAKSEMTDRVKEARHNGMSGRGLGISVGYNGLIDGVDYIGWTYRYAPLPVDTKQQTPTRYMSLSITSLAYIRACRTIPYLRHVDDFERLSEEVNRLSDYQEREQVHFSKGKRMMYRQRKRYNKWYQLDRMRSAPHKLPSYYTHQDWQRNSIEVNRRKENNPYMDKEPWIDERDSGFIDLYKVEEVDIEWTNTPKVDKSEIVIYK